MLNIIWVFFIVSAVMLGFWNGTEAAVVQSITTSAQQAVQLALSLIGVMTLWLGLMNVAEKAGIVNLFAGAIMPIMRRLFPEVPPEHPAMSAMIFNIAANILGLNNAATPFGLRAMQELQTLNHEFGVATHAMCMFLVINTSSVQLIPLSGIAILAANGDGNASSIILPTLLATLCSTIVGVLVATSFAHFTRR